jgi:hypothetical protein
MMTAADAERDTAAAIAAIKRLLIVFKVHLHFSALLCKAIKNASLKKEAAGT